MLKSFLTFFKFAKFVSSYFSGRVWGNSCVWWRQEVIISSCCVCSCSYAPFRARDSQTHSPSPLQTCTPACWRYSFLSLALTLFHFSSLFHICFKNLQCSTLWIKTAFVLTNSAPAVGTTPQTQSTSPPSTTGNDLPTVGGDTEEEDGMKHLQQVSVCLLIFDALRSYDRRAK